MPRVQATENSPSPEAYEQRYLELLQATRNDDDLAFIARVCAFIEMYLREAIEAQLPNPALLQDTWKRGAWTFSLRFRLALAMNLIPENVAPLLDAITQLRNKVLHDSQLGAISEPDVKKILKVLPSDLASRKLVPGSVFPAALQPYQREFRRALLTAFSVCYEAAIVSKNKSTSTIPGGREEAPSAMPRE